MRGSHNERFGLQSPYQHHFFTIVIFIIAVLHCSEALNDGRVSFSPSHISIISYFGSNDLISSALRKSKIIELSVKRITWEREIGERKHC